MKAKIEEFQAMADSDLDGKIKEKEAEQSKIEKDFEKNVKGLQAQYEQFSKDKEEGIAAVKESGLGLMKAVKAHKEKIKNEL